MLSPRRESTKNCEIMAPGDRIRQTALLLVPCSCSSAPLLLCSSAPAPSRASPQNPRAPNAMQALHKERVQRRSQQPLFRLIPQRYAGNALIILFRYPVYTKAGILEINEHVVRACRGLDPRLVWCRRRKTPLVPVPTEPWLTYGCCSMGSVKCSWPVAREART
jgi:hypothetical protein